jgi:hypothetical protein
MSITLGDGISADPGTISARLISANKIWFVALAVVLAVLCSGCSGENVNAGVTIKPVFLPMAFSIGRSGISIVGNKSIATPIGVFSIGASYELPPRAGDSIYVILRDRRTGFDHIYDVQTGVDQFAAVINGITSIAVTNGQVLIDVTSGSIKQVAFRQVTDKVSEAPHAGWMSKIWHNVVGRWVLIIIGGFIALRVLSNKLLL